MSITLNGLAEWIYRLRAMRGAGKEAKATRPNPDDDVTRVRDAFIDEHRLLRDGQATRRISAAHDQRAALRNYMTIL